jgi:hypothetical protein
MIGRTSKSKKGGGRAKPGHLGRVRGETLDGSSRSHGGPRMGLRCSLLAANVQRIQTSLARGSLKWQPSIINCFRESSPDQLLGLGRSVPRNLNTAWHPGPRNPHARNQQILTKAECTEPERNELETTEYLLRKSENIHHISRGVQGKYISKD